MNQFFVVVQPIIMVMSDLANKTGCPNCARLEAMVAALLKEVTELKARISESEAQLKTDSSNSSKPPSSDPPWQPAPPSKPRSGKKPGGQPGHTGVFRQRLPLERVKRIVDYVPAACSHCQGLWPAVPGESWLPCPSASGRILVLPFGPLQRIAQLAKIAACSLRLEIRRTRRVKLRLCGALAKMRRCD